MEDLIPPADPKNPTNNNNILHGRYELGRLLGHGTFAKVYLARNVRTGQNVAMKVVGKEKVIRVGMTEQVKREISVMKMVSHPNIVELHEVMATKSKIYFVMEYVRGGELFRKVAKGRLKEDTARKYFQQLISAVEFCHARGVYHRDLKPENLLLDDNGDLKVSDFGLSAVSDQIRQDGLFHTFCGTPAYVAPEVLGRKGYDGAKVDIWSCGVILFVLMAGYLPFHDQNVMAMYRKIYRGEFRCPRWFSPDLTKLLTRLLDTNPRTRITIPEIMENKWFKKGFKHIKFYIENDQFHTVDDLELQPELQNEVKVEAEAEPKPKPEEDAEAEEKPEAEVENEGEESGNDSDSSVASCPPTLSDGRKKRLGNLPRPLSLNAFDIISFSRGFDLSGLFEERGEEARFLSGEPVETIISKLEEIAKVVKFTVRKKDCRVSLEGTREGEKGPLTIGAEIFELTPSLMVVEVKKKAGDSGEYEEFCNRELKPGLRQLMQRAAIPTSIASEASDTE